MSETRSARDRAALLSDMYAAFNRRDVEAILPSLHPEVAWPNGWEGGFVHGHDGVRDYWARQWAAIDPTVTPLTFRHRPGGELAVGVRQVVRDQAGRVVSDRRLDHVYTFRDGLIAAMDVRGLD